MHAHTHTFCFLFSTTFACAFFLFICTLLLLSIPFVTIVNSGVMTMGPEMDVVTGTAVAWRYHFVSGHLVMNW